MRCMTRLSVLVIGLFLFTGCASVLKTTIVDARTTNLFEKSCKELEEAKKAVDQPKKKSGFFAKVNPAVWVRPDSEKTVEKFNSTVNDCVRPDLERMFEAFISIRETDEAAGFRGDTREEVRRKGFSVYMDSADKIQRPNTALLYGDDALNEVGMGIGQVQTTTVEEAEKITRYKKSLYGEKYTERGLKRIVDRFCINNDESLETGSDYSFVIVWKGDYVLSRVIKGGKVHNPKKTSSFLQCPGGFIGDTIKGTLGSATKSIKFGF